MSSYIDSGFNGVTTNMLCTQHGWSLCLEEIVDVRRDVAIRTRRALKVSLHEDIEVLDGELRIAEHRCHGEVGCNTNHRLAVMSS